MTLGQLRTVGWPAALALLLTAVATAGALWLPQEQARLDARRATLVERRHAAQRVPGPASVAADASAFARSLPADAERQSRTAALLALSAELGLPWPRTEFRYQADREAGLAQYRIAMNVAGRYEVLRRFVAEALRRDPALALEGVRLRREANGELQVELAWVLHMQVSR